MEERTILEKNISDYDFFKNEVSELISIIELAKEEKDQEFLFEAETKLIKLESMLRKKELELMLSGEVDHNDTFIDINAGAGGTESQDWVQMLLRMYTRWCDKKGYKALIIHENQGEEAGIKSVTVKISGFCAYGWLKKESGVHRLVRISPFDSQDRRHTSFASVWV